MRARLTTFLLLLGLVMIAWTSSPAQNGNSGGDSEGLYAPPDISNLGRWKAPVQDEKPADAYLQVAMGEQKPAAKPRRESAFVDRSPNVTRRTETTPAVGTSDTADLAGDEAGVWPLSLANKLALAGLAISGLALAVMVVLRLRRESLGRRPAPTAALILGLPQARPSSRRVPFRQDEDAPPRRRAA